MVPALASHWADDLRLRQNWKNIIQINTREGLKLNLEKHKYSLHLVETDLIVNGAIIASLHQNKSLDSLIRLSQMIKNSFAKIVF